MSARGFALVPALGFILVLAVLAYGASRSGPAAVAQLAGAQDAAAARYAAEAGVARAIWQAQRSDCTGYASLIDQRFGSARYDAHYSAAAGSPVTVTATAALPGGASASFARTADVFHLPVTVSDQPGAEQADMYLRSDDSSGYPGAAQEIEVWSEGGAESRALLGIDLGPVPSGATVRSATLELYANSIQLDAPGGLEAHRLTRSWNEFNATWTHFDAALALLGLWATPGGDYDPGAFAALALENGTTGWQALDATRPVQQWLGGEEPNYGILLKAQGAVKRFRFHSSDETTASLRPRLRVEYVCPCAASCSAPAGDGTEILLSALEDSTLAAVAFEDGDLVRHDPAAATALMLLREDDAFAADEDIDALSWSDDGRLVLSTNSAATLAGLAFEDGDLVEYDPATGTAVMIFDGSARFAVNEDVDAVHRYADGRIVLSTENVASLAGLAFQADDLVEYHPGADTATLIFAGAAHFAAAENVDAAQLLADGRFLLSTDTDARLASLDFTDADVVLYDPLADTAALVFDGAALTSWPDADVDAVHDLRPHALAGELRLEPVADTYMSNAVPDTAFGDAPALRVGNNLRTLLRFDLAALPVGATVTSAALYLNSDAAGTGHLAGAYPVTASWEESTATWNSTGGGSCDPLPAGTATFATATALWTRWVLPASLIHEWRDGVRPNYGLLVKPTVPMVGQAVSRSREHTSTAVHPRLVLQYTLP